MNDDGRPFLYPARLFNFVDRSEPADWCSIPGADGERYAYPAELGRPGFFEDYFNGDRPTMATLYQYLANRTRPRRTRTRSAG